MLEFVVLCYPSTGRKLGARYLGSQEWEPCEFETSEAKKETMRKKQNRSLETGRGRDWERQTGRQTNMWVCVGWTLEKQRRIRLGLVGWGAGRIGRKEWAVLISGVTKKVGPTNLGWSRWR